MIPYGRQSIDESDIQAVVDTLRSDWLTTGPKVEEFERAVASKVGVHEGVAVSSGTAGLHAAIHAIGIIPGDEVILSPLTFVSTANAIVMEGGIPIFADVDPHTLLIAPDSVHQKISTRTRAILAVDYAGQPCDYPALQSIAQRYGLTLVADACHSLGATLDGHPVGSLADVTVFSFHPVKAITTAEGGMVVTNDSLFADNMRRFRNHGITTDHRERSIRGTWCYEMVELGWNYRLSDLQCALGLTQLEKLSGWIQRRQAIASQYDLGLKAMSMVHPVKLREGVTHAYHLYVVLLQGDSSSLRSELYHSLTKMGIGTQVHYMPVHLHPYYQKRFGVGVGHCPVAEQAYERMLSLPIYPGMTNENIAFVIDGMSQCLTQVVESDPITCSVQA
jgi:perosamine synthetase